jgi:cytochrome b pre-mRNA-processing protein 3
MFWPFNRRVQTGPTIDAIYGMIVAQARLPHFYAVEGVPDTVNGRFDMVVLHLWLVLRRLRELSDRGLAQNLFDHFCGDLDANLREMGESDTGVPRKMRAFAEAFYGRAQAYDHALAADAPDVLAAALARNVFGVAKTDAGAGRLADYVRRAVAKLGDSDLASIRDAGPLFPVPVGGTDGEAARAKADPAKEDGRE